VRGEARQEEAEPGFGPFRGRQREGAPGADRPKRARAGQRADDEARAVRSVAEEAVARASGERPALRIVHGTDHGADTKANGSRAGKGRGSRRAAPGGAPAAPRPKPVRDAARLQEALARGARALDRGYEREALKILRPWREAHPDSSELRELLGLTYYRLGRWSLAQKELEAFVGLTDSTDQHPVLMDVARALGRFKRVEQLWDELKAVSPGAELVTEGRIVYAGAHADRGKLDEAIKVLERAPGNPKRVLPHHLRLWYALADLHERAGDIPTARALFRKISAQDPSFVDVAERLAALS
jgi:tetratricopeptide (TPR) repeat protein